MNSKNKNRSALLSLEPLMGELLLDGSHNTESRTIFKASALAPRAIFERLPEQLVRYLNEELDSHRTNALRALTAPLQHLEFILSEHLFSRHDRRAFVARLRSHSRATAAISRTIAAQLSLPLDASYLCGLLHDVGTASCIRHFDELGYTLSDANFDQLHPTIMRSSASHAIFLASYFRFPSGLRHALRDCSCYETLEDPSLIATATILAEQIAIRLGFPFINEPDLTSKIIQDAVNKLAITENTLTILFRNANDAVSEINDYSTATNFYSLFQQSSSLETVSK
jgi:hypothetical protein